MAYVSSPFHCPVDHDEVGTYLMDGHTREIAEYRASLVRLIAVTNEVTTREIFMTMHAVFEELREQGSPPLELERRGEELRHDRSLLLDADEMSMAELLAVVARSAENFQWLVDQLPAGPKREKAEAQLTDWKARMVPLLERIGRPKVRPVLRRRKLK